MDAPDEDPTTQRACGDRPLRFWRRVSLRKQMLYGFAAPVLVVLLASLFLLRALDTLSRSAKVNVESTESIGMRQELLNAVLDSETGLRGYELTGDPEFLQPYTSGLRNFVQIGNRLKATEAGNVAELQNLQQIQMLFQRWLHEFAEPQIALRQGAPVGEAHHLRLLASLADAPTREASSPDAIEPDAIEHLRAYDRALEWLHASLGLIATGPRADELKAVLLLAARIQSSSPDAAVARAQLVATLQALADKIQADDDRISSNISSKQGKKLIDAIRMVIQTSLDQQTIERNTAAVVATADTNHAIWVALVVPVAALLIGLALTLLLLVDAISAINATGSAANAVAGGDLQKRLKVLRRDEIGELGNAFNRMAEELADRNRRGIAIDRFQTQLMTSNSMDEIYDVVARMCTDMFPGVG
ncbi:MAG TPA: CHASE3 domain-containing protein, partial [Xanthomonadaceae bacterium]|nr:CHASE3 domain-containing protein [Xanthomonadaceae bacterium]